jgi:hypothetical protein
MRDELLETLAKHLDEAEKYWWPKTVGYSGDSRTRLVPNCVGPSGTGDCPLQWTLDPDEWPRGSWPELVREHEFSHATYDEWWHLADINAKRRIIARLGDSIDVELLVMLLLPYGLSRADFGEGETS